MCARCNSNNSETKRKGTLNSLLDLVIQIVVFLLITVVAEAL